MAMMHEWNTAFFKYLCNKGVCLLLLAASVSGYKKFSFAMGKMKSISNQTSQAMLCRPVYWKVIHHHLASLIQVLMLPFQLRNKVSYKFWLYILQE